MSPGISMNDYTSYQWNSFIGIDTFLKFVAELIDNIISGINI